MDDINKMFVNCTLKKTKEINFKLIIFYFYYFDVLILKLNKKN